MLVHSKVYKVFFPIRSSEDLYDPQKIKYRKKLIKEVGKYYKWILLWNSDNSWPFYYRASTESIIEVTMKLSRIIEQNKVLTQDQLYVLNYLIYLNKYNKFFKIFLPVDPTDCPFFAEGKHEQEKEYWPGRGENEDK